MKLKNSLGLAVVAMILGGCETLPQDLDAMPAHESFVVNEKLNDLYYRLTTVESKEAACRAILSSNIYVDRGEFRIYYGLVSGGLAPVTITTNAVYATKQGDQTAVVLKDGATTLPHNKTTRQLLNFIKTGNCK
ncbi:hypothetical protein [Stutzerimonas stutzeri]|uniref:hypothetical protein n=1 Tax=Stutzerimonas stutzeri TaxID=316 RepID=UPI001CFEACFC|nr:hypothetical protein [Stutzerimonas stutzeri]